MDSRAFAAASAAATASPTQFDDPFVAWESARDEANDAYAAWCNGSSETWHETYAVFVAASDREETAAASLARYAAAS
jgi:hypothetical protein